MADKKWEYAIYAKIAKINGGPRQLIETVAKRAADKGFDAGQKSMYPFLAIIAVGGLALGVGAEMAVQKLAAELKKKRDVSEAALEQAKDEFVEEIESYMAEHPDDSEDLKIVEADSVEAE